MAAPPLQNTFEGGTNGVAITVGNSGGASGDAWDVVNGTTWVYDTTRAYNSSVSMKAINPSGQYVEWAGLGTLTVTFNFRMYVYMDAIPTAHWAPTFAVTNAFTNSAWPTTFGSDGQLYAQDATGGFATPVGPYNVGQWIRVETAILPHISAGSIETRLYNNPSDPVNSWSYRQIRPALNTGTDIDRMRIGDTGNPPGTLTATIDGVAVGITGFIGPAPSGELKLQVPSVPFW